jgi:hypothetical protein
MGKSQTAEQIEYTEESFVENSGKLALLVRQQPCPLRNRAIRDLLEEMNDNLEYLTMR